VYLPSCINRIFGNARGHAEHPAVPEALVAISRRAGLPLWIPDDVAGHCCATPWTSKGFGPGRELMISRTSAALSRWSRGGQLPVVVDATSCAHGLIEEVVPSGVEVLDSIAWVHDRLLDRLELTRKLGSAAVHPTCASSHLGLSGKLASIVQRIADEVVVPAASGCCGMAGDRGWLHPELPASALRDLATELEGRAFDACVSSNRTCEIALQQVTGLSYSSFVIALEELTRR
jgi:D-lactate dehydrogenase